TLLGAAATAAWPLAAEAQQPKVPVIGYLSPGSAAASAQPVAVFRQSLAEAGYVVGRNAAIEYRFAEGQYDRLPAMAAELVRSEVALIVAGGGTAPALAAKAATAAIPIVFSVTDDPVALGLVVSFARPGGNATGINFPLAELAAKELGLLHELVPAARRIGLLVNPNNSPSAAVTKDVTAAASALGVEIGVVEANNGRAIEAAFTSLVRSRSEALLIGTDPFFFSRRVQLATLAARHVIPAAFNARECRSRRPNELRNQPHRGVPAARRLCRAHSQGGQTRRSAGCALGHVRVPHQFVDRQGARPRNSLDRARTRRRSDRVTRRIDPTRVRGVGRGLSTTRRTFISPCAGAWPLAAGARARERRHSARAGPRFRGDGLARPVFAERHAGADRAPPEPRGGRGAGHAPCARTPRRARRGDRAA